MSYNINNVRYSDVSLLMRDKDRKLLVLLDNVVKESENKRLNINIKKMMAFSMVVSMRHSPRYEGSKLRDLKSHKQ